MRLNQIKIMNELINDFSNNTVSENDADDPNRQGPNKSFYFKIKSSTDQITKTVQKFDELLENHNCCSPRTKSELSTALSEALANAIVHGNKINPDEFVDLKVHIYQDRMVLTVKDKGAGFNHTKLPNPLDPENIKKPSGRGVYLMSVLVDKVDFIRCEDGMEVRLVKYLQKQNNFKV